MTMMEEANRDAHEQVVDRLVRTGAAPDRQTSRRIVREVIEGILDQPVEMDPISDGDLYLLGEESYIIMNLVWEIEEGQDDTSRRKLLEIITRSQRILRVAHRYVSPYHGTDMP